MKNLKTVLLLMLLISSISTINAQRRASMIVVLGGQVTEMGTLIPVKQLPLHIEKVRPFATDDYGSFQVPVPFDSGAIVVQLRHPGYEIMEPLDGAKIMKKGLLPNTQVEMKIWVLGSNADESLRNQIKQAQSQVKRLKKKNQLTGLQLEALNHTLLDTINAFEIKKKKYRGQIKSLRNKLSSTERDNQSLKQQVSKFEKQIAEMESTNAQLIRDLADALEERYLRQKKYFEEISSGLLEYVSRLKDYRDQLTQIKFVFKNYQAGQYFATTVGDYSHIRNELNKEREGQREAIGHYWESTELSANYAQIVDGILENIHDAEILPLNQSVIQPIQMAATGKKAKIKKVEKTAKQAVDRINQKIDTLEPQLEKFLISLREF